MLVMPRRNNNSRSGGKGGRRMKPRGRKAEDAMTTATLLNQSRQEALIMEQARQHFQQTSQTDVHSSIMSQPNSRRQPQQIQQQQQHQYHQQQQQRRRRHQQQQQFSLSIGRPVFTRRGKLIAQGRNPSLRGGPSQHVGYIPIPSTMPIARIHTSSRCLRLRIV